MYLFLIGMSGSGKSYWATQLAEHLQCSSIDLDKYIETAAQKSIPEIFTIGEDYFRTLEQEALRHIPLEYKKDIVVATGGGAPCFHDNLAWMKQKGLVIYLKASVDELFDNLKNSITERPLLKSDIPEAIVEKIEGLLHNRGDVYEQAHIIVDAKNATVSTFANLIADFKNKKD